MPSYWRGLGLRWKTILMLALGLVLVFGAFGYVAGRTLAQSIDAALQESLSNAEALGASIDALIRRAYQQMDGATKLPGLQREVQEQRQTASDIFEVMSSFDAIWLMDSRGQTIWRQSHHPNSSQDQTQYRALALQAMNQGRPVVSQPGESEPGRMAVAVIGAPVMGPDGRPRAAIVGEIPLDHAGTELVPLPHVTPASEFYIIDDEGAVIVTPSEEIDETYHNEHLALLGPFIQDRRPGVKRHRSDFVEDHVVAFVPLSMIGGGVIFEEHGDQVLAIAQRLRRALLILGSTAMVLASVGAWLYVRHMVQPVLALREASDRIAGGNLLEPVRVERQDEIGDLAQAFESMRIRLLEAEREHLEWERELQDRVRAQSDQVRQLLGRVISAQEAERKRIARELHDGATQMVTTLLLQIEGMASALPPDSPAARELAPSARTYANQALEEMRRVILDLRPPALDDLGLVAALRDYAEQKLAEAGIALEFNTVGEPLHLNGNLETAIYRIIQEAINNLASHSQAARGSVTLEFQPGTLRAEIRDDGRGFVLEEALKNASGVGIAGMLERAEILGGHLSVLSTPGSGTRVSLEVPIEPG